MDDVAEAEDADVNVAVDEVENVESLSRMLKSSLRQTGSL